MNKFIYIFSFCLSLFLTNHLLSQNSDFPIEQSNLDSLVGKKIKELNKYLLSFEFKLEGCHYLSYNKYTAVGIVFSIEEKSINVIFKKEFRIKSSQMYKKSQIHCLETKKIRNIKIESIELIN